MYTCAAVLDELKKNGTEKGRAMYVKHGMPADRVLGVSVADLKIVAKRIKGEQELAYELFDTGMMEAMYLAGMVAAGGKMSRELLDHWANGAAALAMVGEHTVPWVAVESRYGREAALAWMDSELDGVAASGWCTYSGLVAVTADSALDLGEVEGLLARVGKELGRAKNRERYTMNGFVISVGAYVAPLTGAARELGAKMGKVEVDMGGTACKVPSVVEQIAKLEGMGKIGQKRKTIRC